MPVPNYLGVNPDIYNNDNEIQYIETIADLHGGAKFSVIGNTYSMDILRERLEKSLNQTIKFVQEKQLSRISVLSLGDIVQGMLRVSDVKLNEKWVSDALVFVMRLMADYLNKLSAYCYVDFYQVCFSNHDQPRMLGTKANELAGEDLGKIFFAYITDILSNNDRVKVIGDTENNCLEFNFAGFDCIALHGHTVSNLKTLSKDLSAHYRKFYDYVFVGHTHSAQIFTNEAGDEYDMETIVSSSVVGIDPYADKLLVGSKPSVQILGFHKTYGHVETKKIIL